MPVAICQQTISSAEFAEWMAFDKISPISVGDKLDVLFARSDALFAEAHRDRKKRSTPYQVADFLPVWARPKQPQPGDPDALLRKAEAITQAMMGF
jgi:hypothetical protein